MLVWREGELSNGTTDGGSSLCGNDLIERGFKPGPTFKKALEVAHKIQIDQDITEKDILFRQVKSIVKGN